MLSADWQHSYRLEGNTPLVWNLTRSFVATIVATVGATSDPKVQFVTSDADWSTRRRAQKLDQFADALALVECPPYANVHELRVALLRDAAIFGRGRAQVSANVKRKQVMTQRVMPWEILVDARAARYGVPSEVTRAYPISRWALKAQIEGRDADIDAAKEARSQDLETELGITSSIARSVGDQVQVYEVWLMAQGEDSKGRHIMVLDDCPEPLIDEEYELEIPPIPTLYWDHPVVGDWNQSLADECAPNEDEINRGLLRLSEAAKRTALNTIFAKSQSIPNKITIEETTDSTVVEFDGNEPPKMERAEPINESMVKWIELLRGVAHDLTGISEMASTGAREPGLTSGAAVRAVSAQQSKRFAWLWKQVEQWQVQWARLAIAATRHIADVDPSFEAKWTGSGFLKSIKWADVDLDEDKYVMQPYPVGASKNTPADRLQRAEELFVGGVISQRSYQAIKEGSLDVPAETREQNLQRELISSYVESWLDATPEQLESGWISEEKRIRLLQPPIKWLNMGDCILQVALSYTEACLNGAPDENKQLFLDWLEMADAILEQQAAKRAEMAQQFQGLTNEQTKMANQGATT